MLTMRPLMTMRVKIMLVMLKIMSVMLLQLMMVV